MSLPLLTWTKLQVNMPNGAFWPLIMIRGSQLYAISGFDQSFAPIKDIYVFDIGVDGSLSNPVFLGEVPANSFINGLANQSYDYDMCVAAIPQNVNFGITTISIPSRNEVIVKKNFPAGWINGKALAMDGGRLWAMGGSSGSGQVTLFGKYDNHGNITQYKSLGVDLPEVLVAGPAIAFKGKIIIPAWLKPGAAIGHPRWATLGSDGSIGALTSFSGLTLGIPDIWASTNVLRMANTIHVVGAWTSVEQGYNAVLHLDDGGRPKFWTTYPALLPGQAQSFSVGTDGSRFLWAQGTFNGVTFDTDFWVLRVS